jgi:hypothetical protein
MFTVTLALDGVAPDGGVAANQLAPSLVEVLTLKARLPELKLRRERFCAIGLLPP